MDQFPRLGFFVLDLLSIFSDYLSQEKLTQKWQEPKAEQFAKLQVLNDKIDQNTNFAKLPSGKWLFQYELEVQRPLTNFHTFLKNRDIIMH